MTFTLSIATQKGFLSGNRSCLKLTGCQLLPHRNPPDWGIGGTGGPRAQQEGQRINPEGRGPQGETLNIADGHTQRPCPQMRPRIRPAPGFGGGIRPPESRGHGRPPTRVATPYIAQVGSPNPAQPSLSVHGGRTDVHARDDPIALHENPKGGSLLTKLPTGAHANRGSVFGFNDVPHHGLGFFRHCTPDHEEARPHGDEADPTAPRWWIAHARGRRGRAHPESLSPLP
jgi:hypothetical protein